MLTIIRCYDSFVEKEILEKARANLSQFQNLKFIFNNFASFSFNNSHNKNTVFGKCIKGDINSMDYLKRLEKALSNLIAKKKLAIKTNRRVNTEFIKRMTSNEPWHFSSAISDFRRQSRNDKTSFLSSCLRLALSFGQNDCLK